MSLWVCEFCTYWDADASKKEGTAFKWGHPDMEKNGKMWITCRNEWEDNEKSSWIPFLHHGFEIMKIYKQENNIMTNWVTKADTVFLPTRGGVVCKHFGSTTRIYLWLKISMGRDTMKAALKYSLRCFIKQLVAI